MQPAQRLVPVHRGEGWQPVGVGPGKPQELAGFALTDNRKDASLQSGHLNDFAQVGLLRGALYAAAGAAGPAGLGREVLTGGAVVRALTLPQSEWAREPETKSSLLRGESERALREVVATDCMWTCSGAGGSRCRTWNRRGCWSSATPIWTQSTPTRSGAGTALARLRSAAPPS